MTLLSTILSASSAVAGSANGLATTDASDLVVQGLSSASKQACGLADGNGAIPLASMQVRKSQWLRALRADGTLQTCLDYVQTLSITSDAAIQWQYGTFVPDNGIDWQTTQTATSKTNPQMATLKAAAKALSE
jgi:hypothetical protein